MSISVYAKVLVKLHQQFVVQLRHQLSEQLDAQVQARLHRQLYEQLYGQPHSRGWSVARTRPMQF